MIDFRSLQTTLRTRPPCPSTGSASGSTTLTSTASATSCATTASACSSTTPPASSWCATESKWRPLVAIVFLLAPVAKRFVSVHIESLIFSRDSFRQLVLCLGWNVRLIVSLPRRYDVMTLRKPIVTWYVKTFRNVNYVCWIRLEFTYFTGLIG